MKKISLIFLVSVLHVCVINRLINVIYKIKWPVKTNFKDISYLGEEQTKISITRLVKLARFPKQGKHLECQAIIVFVCQ